MVDLEATLRASLDRQYAIEGEVGRGGMSVVYRARDLKHNRTVAIKVLRPELSEQIATDRFQREIEVVAGLTHPHILPLHDSGEVDGLLYYVMPFIEGESLRARVDRDGRLPVPDAMRIAREISFAHTWDQGEVEFYLGEQNNVKIGHGSLMDGYFNSTQIDYYQGGIFLQGHYLGNGLEFTMNNVIAPEILAGRVFIAPLGWFMKNSWAERLEIGFTLGADIAAPYRTEGTGKTTIWAAGGDVAFRAIDKTWLVLTPYVALMGMDGDVGFHDGLSATWEISASKKLQGKSKTAIQDSLKLHYPLDLKAFPLSIELLKRQQEERLPNIKK